MGADEWRVMLNPMTVELLTGHSRPPLNAHNQFQHDLPSLVVRTTVENCKSNTM